MIHSMQLVKTKLSASSALRVATVTAGLFALAACASTPQTANQQIQAAEQAIASAERTHVADYASPALGEAREKLAAARSAADTKKIVTAQRLADEATADAQLASAQAAVARARVVNDEMLKGTDTLKQEMQRNTGEAQ